MNVSPGDREVRILAAAGLLPDDPAPISSGAFTGRDAATIRMVGEQDEDPGAVILTCANCGAEMDERKCKLICRCGYFLSFSDYY